jgi:alpha-D-xyloside xylohydrolase
MMRALCVDHPGDPVAWQADLEYLLGPDLLVAPMTSPEGSRQVYLPAGEWVDHWTGEVLTGGRYVTAVRPLDQIPLYVRHGALVAVAEAGDTVPEDPEITLVSYGWAGPARTVLLDPSGDTEVTADRDGDVLRVTVSGPARVTAVEFAPVAGSPTSATITKLGDQP